MNLHWIDWTIVIGVMTLVTGIAISTNKYTQSVADFLAASRCAGRYLLSISAGMAGLGAISVVAKFEMFYAAGFTASWWMMMMMPLGVIAALSGWVIYRFRETRAMTLAQFFEMRYSRNFRIYAGIVAFLSGIINFGIFPAVGARFFIYFCGLPLYNFEFLGREFSLMFIGIMVLLLTISMFFVFMGGQIAVMITDFVQGIFTNIVLLILMGIIFWKFDWSVMIDTLQTHAPENASMINPFETSKVEGFNVWFFLIGLFGFLYGFRAWQGSSGYNCSAKSAHEAKMAGILGEWRGLVLILLLMLIPIGAYVIMHHPNFQGVAAEVNQALTRISPDADDTIRKQMTVPVILAKMLPVGVVGMMCAVMIAAFVSTHDTYLHSWGSIFIQDVILPFRKKPFTPRQHIWLLRLAILGVAVFIFFFSLLFQQNDFILMFFAITGAIYVGGAGSVIIGGLYWKRGTTEGAWAALTIGAGVAIGGLVLRQTWPGMIYPFLDQQMPSVLAGLKFLLHGISDAVPGINWYVEPGGDFPINGQWFNFFAMILALSSYVLISLFLTTVGGRKPHNMDRLLHRGKYAVKGDHEGEIVKPVTGWRTLLPSAEFTRGDRFIYYAKLVWSLGWFGVFLIGTIWNSMVEVSDASWATFWWWRVMITVVVGTATTIWFLIGGIHDVRDLFKTLRTLKRDHTDSGMVTTYSDEEEEDLGPEYPTTSSVLAAGATADPVDPGEARSLTGELGNPNYDRDDESVSGKK